MGRRPSGVGGAPLGTPVAPAGRTRVWPRAIVSGRSGHGEGFAAGELAHALGDAGAPGHNPVFEVRFALQNHPVPDVALPGLSAKLRMRSTGTARFHLACEITEEAEQLEVVWLFRPKLFPEAEVENLGRIFQNLLAGACRSPETSIAALTREL